MSLKDFLSANEELEQITPRLRANYVYLHKARCTDWIQGSSRVHRCRVPLTLLRRPDPAAPAIAFKLNVGSRCRAAIPHPSSVRPPRPLREKICSPHHLSRAHCPSDTKRTPARAAPTRTNPQSGRNNRQPAATTRKEPQQLPSPGPDFPLPSRQICPSEPPKPFPQPRNPPLNWLY